MDFGAIIGFAALAAVGRWVYRSVMEKAEADAQQNKPRPDRTSAPTAPGNAARPVKQAPAVRPLPGAARNTARPNTSSTKRDAGRDSTKRDVGRSTPRAMTASRTTAPDDWYVVLDVPRDAPRSEIIAAVKRRVERARLAGDTGGTARIMRAAEAGLRGSGQLPYALKGLRQSH